MFYIHAIVLAITTRVAEANSFLQLKPQSPSAYVDRHVVEQTLSELSAASNFARLREIEDELKPMYAALPKGQHGKLDPPTVRYALHRYFVGKHGWYMSGLGVEEDLSSNASSSAALMKDWAPAYIQSLFPQTARNQGMGLHDLSVFASALSDLAHSEASGNLNDIFEAMMLPSAGDVGRAEWELAIKAYMVEYLLGGEVMEILYKKGVSEGPALEDFLSRFYPPWVDTYMYIEDLHEAYDRAQASQLNPFRPREYTLDHAVGFVEDFAHNFNHFQNLDCHGLKSKLLDMEHEGTGRVRLSRFYVGGLNGDFSFTEQEAYLRHIGALDESDPSKPSVVIPNYLTSASNCLTTSGFYKVCCIDECESLLRRVETQIASPYAPPARLVELVSGLSSDTVDAPRNLSSALVARLHGVANYHGGKVPLHSRLFSQWMHHAFPRECSFPQVGKVGKSMSPDGWMLEHGGVTASQEQMQLHVDSHVVEVPPSPEAALELLPWSDVEELLTKDLSTSESNPLWSQVSSSLRVVMACAALLSFAAPLVRAAATSRSSGQAEKGERFMV